MIMSDTASIKTESSTKSCTGLQCLSILNFRKGFSECNERLNEVAKLYIGGSLNIPYSSYEEFDGYIS